jgi:tRNA(Arg) A34 adenosine deaminase TadA
MMKPLLKGMLIGAVLVVIAVFSFPSKLYLKNPRWRPDSGITARLSLLADSAINTSDVPVAALLTYDNAVIGIGYNTVRRDRQAGGHAEINAISNAICNGDLDSFMKLDRSKLVLITTWEPCAMCRGAIIEYKIEQVNVLKMKSMFYWYRQWKEREKYEWNKRAAITDTLQEHLFRKHPLFKDQKKDM